MTDLQFEDAFTAAGGWFLLTQFKTIYTWTGDTRSLVDHLYAKGFDKDRSGTSTRVSSVLRIIKAEKSREAIIKVRDSRRINKAHPEAFSIAQELLSELI